MKRVICIFIGILLVLPAFAEGEQQQQQSLDKTAVVAAASYVDGAYNAIASAKQDKLTSSNVVESGSGAMVTDVSASDGTVTVTKTEVTIPVGGQSSLTRAPIWVQ